MEKYCLIRHAGNLGVFTQKKENKLSFFSTISDAVDKIYRHSLIL
jgi:hypothetical protein